MGDLPWGQLRAKRERWCYYYVMGMAERQDLPSRPQEKAEWSLRRLFGGTTATVSAAFTKVFVSPFEWLFTFCVFVVAIGELGGAHLSSFFYWIGGILLACMVLRRVFSSMQELREEDAEAAVDHGDKG